MEFLIKILVRSVPTGAPILLWLTIANFYDSKFSADFFKSYAIYQFCVILGGGGLPVLALKVGVNIKNLNKNVLHCQMIYLNTIFFIIISFAISILNSYSSNANENIGYIILSAYFGALLQIKSYLARGFGKDFLSSLIEPGIISICLVPVVIFRLVVTESEFWLIFLTLSFLIYIITPSMGSFSKPRPSYMWGGLLRKSILLYINSLLYYLSQWGIFFVLGLFLLDGEIVELGLLIRLLAPIQFIINTTRLLKARELAAHDFSSGMSISSKIGFNSLALSLVYMFLCVQFANYGELIFQQKLVFPSVASTVLTFGLNLPSIYLSAYSMILTMNGLDKYVTYGLIGRLISTIAIFYIFELNVYVGLISINFGLTVGAILWWYLAKRHSSRNNLKFQ